MIGVDARVHDEAYAHEAYATGFNFASEHLSEIFPKLLNLTVQVQKEKNLQPEEVAFIFLDRDSRVALHAWQEFTHRKYTAIPLVVSRVQFPDITTAFTHFNYDYWQGSPVTYQEIENEFKERVLQPYLDRKRSEKNVGEWLIALTRILEKKLLSKKHVIIIDIGFTGSMAYLAKYIVDDLVKNETDRTSQIQLLFGAASVSAAPFLKEGSSAEFEHTTPHGTVGYTLGNDTWRMRYQRTPDKVKIERAYIHGCVDYFKKR